MVVEIQHPWRTYSLNLKGGIGNKQVKGRGRFNVREMTHPIMQSHKVRQNKTHLSAYKESQLLECDEHREIRRK